jgi:hypothetical protein
LLLYIVTCFIFTKRNYITTNKYKRKNLHWHTSHRFTLACRLFKFSKLSAISCRICNYLWSLRYLFLSVICAAFLWSVPIDKARVDVLDHIRNLVGQFIFWHALTNEEGCVLWCNHARSMSVVANENNVTLCREVNCKMRLLAIEYSIKLNQNQKK